MCKIMEDYVRESNSQSVTEFRQNFEMQTNCKTVRTMFKRFARKYPRAWSVWGELFEYMFEHNIEHMEEAGWCLWLYWDMEDVQYMAIVLTDKAQEL